MRQLEVAVGHLGEARDLAADSREDLEGLGVRLRPRAAISSSSSSVFSPMALRGLRTSWATCAAIDPITANLWAWARVRGPAPLLGGCPESSSAWERLGTARGGLAVAEGDGARHVVELLSECTGFILRQAPYPLIVVFEAICPATRPSWTAS